MPDYTNKVKDIIEKELGDPWIPWNDVLLCDRAIAAPVPSEKEIRPYTRSTALDALRANEE